MPLLAGIPISKLVASEREKLLHLPEELHKRVIGQVRRAMTNMALTASSLLPTSLLTIPPPLAPHSMHSFRRRPWPLSPMPSNAREPD